MYAHNIAKLRSSLDIILVLYILQKYTSLTSLNQTDPPNDEEDYCFMEQTDDSKVSKYLTIACKTGVHALPDT